jgi:hypothetical protein
MRALPSLVACTVPVSKWGHLVMRCAPSSAAMMVSTSACRIAWEDAYEVTSWDASR